MIKLLIWLLFISIFYIIMAVITDIEIMKIINTVIGCLCFLCSCCCAYDIIRNYINKK